MRRRLQDDAVASDKLIEMKELGEDASKVLPHREGDRLALFRRFLGIGGCEIVEGPSVPRQLRRYEPPDAAGKGGSKFERQRRKNRCDEAKPRIFNGVA